MLAQAGLPGKTRRRFKAPTAAGQAQTVVPNQLNRAWTVKAPETVSGGDLPSLPTGAGWLSLAVVLELGSRAVGGWSMADQRRAELVNQALAMALWQRQPAVGLIMHTDRGSQDGADSSRQLLPQPGAALPKWKRRMAARRRKTLVVCRACNELIQYGNYDGKTSQRT